MLDYHRRADLDRHVATSGNLPQILVTLDAPELRENPNVALYLDIAKGPNIQPLPVTPLWSDDSSALDTWVL